MTVYHGGYRAYVDRCEANTKASRERAAYRKKMLEDVRRMQASLTKANVLQRTIRSSATRRKNIPITLPVVGGK